jgi:hypothetical protein
MNGTQIFLFRLCRLPFYIMSLPSMPIRRHILALDKQESKFNPTLFRTGLDLFAARTLAYINSKIPPRLLFCPIYFATPCALCPWQAAAAVDQSLLHALGRAVVVHLPAAVVWSSTPVATGCRPQHVRRRG